MNEDLKGEEYLHKQKRKREHIFNFMSRGEQAGKNKLYLGKSK